MGNKKYTLNRKYLIILFVIIPGMLIFNLINKIPAEIENNEIIFIMYRNTILNINIEYILLAIMIYINIKEYNIYFNIYCIIKYENFNEFINEFIKKIFINVSMLILVMNASFISIMGFISFNYITKTFILYILISSMVQILGFTMIFLFIVIINLIINKLIISSSIVFLIITINDAISRVLKSDIKTIGQLLFYRSSSESFYSDIYIQISIGMCIIFIVIFFNIIIERNLKKRDFINESEK